MKFATKLVLAALFLANLSLTGFAQDYYYDEGSYDSYTENWEIDNFEAEINLNKNSSANITEKIVADFTSEGHRGILRTIPYEYENGYKVYIDYKSATDPQGNSWDVDPYKEYGYLNIPMRTPENHISNEIETFLLEYKVSNIITFFDDFDEFYWNINGTDWPVPTKAVSATIRLPTDEIIQIDCITGEYSESSQDCKWEQEGNIVNVYATRGFNAYENLTIIIGLPKGIFHSPSAIQQLWWSISDNKGILIGPATFIFMFLLWFKRGRDDKTVKDTVIPHYKPPEKLLPSEVGTIIDESVHPHDISATIIDFAIKGNINIKEIEEKKFIGKKTDYELTLVKPWGIVKDYETKILEALFMHNRKGAKRKISSLVNKFYVHVESVKKSIIRELIKDGYFPHNPMSVRKVYTTIGAVVLVIIFNFGFALAEALSFATIIGITISAVIILAFGFIMPRKTKKGTEIYYQLKGLYEYIDTAEKDRMKFQEEHGILFEKLLPYAMAFGLVKKWTAAFDGILTRPPSWFMPFGGNWGQGYFSMNAFADKLNSFSYKTTGNITSRPGGKGGGAWSGGSGFSGGFSGGGFGGGGGRGL